MKGYKTYITAALMLIVAIAGLFGINVPGFEAANAGELMSGALGLIFLRSGIKSDTNK